jgi:hypothetical protein
MCYARCRRADGTTFKTTKGAPHVILKLLDQAADAQIIHACEAKVWGVRVGTRKSFLSGCLHVVVCRPLDD